MEAIAQGLGIDVAKLKQDMQRARKWIRSCSRTTISPKRWASTGTPAFVIGETLIPGAVKLEDLKAQIVKARENAS